MIFLKSFQFSLNRYTDTVCNVIQTFTCVYVNTLQPYVCTFSPVAFESHVFEMNIETILVFVANRILSNTCEHLRPSLSEILVLLSV